MTTITFLRHLHRTMTKWSRQVEEICILNYSFFILCNSIFPSFGQKQSILILQFSQSISPILELTNGRWYLSSKNPLGIFINVVTMAGLNINDAPIQFNAVVLEDLHTSPEGLLNQLISKYRGEALRQVYKVIGSADFIGNPVGLFNNITAGVQDVFYEPYHGILVGEGIQELGVGLAKGAKSLVKK